MGTATTTRAATDRPRTADIFAVGSIVRVLREGAGADDEGTVVAIDSLGVTIHDHDRLLFWPWGRIVRLESVAA